ncbi:Stp1/IreP family PP2C-type Ser/Thr phosphatase [Sediminibacillus albus]|uniref:protein-serine/threonine phosphatase n=1 Tax=Sediminibacillus albus TaxID=407036 RepID=A0A1G8W4T3_9BACI|nr:Stp1/IreP family PP2C-type Ser/Thr phosphatase [Sediminibacillus albus]SDJ73308.1 Serine/threonine protein phosphatase PrpC [Sediminibacillus albus]
MNGYYLTDQGQVRNHNEDDGGFFSNSNQQTLAVIADGMGGHKAGDVASQMATSLLSDLWKETEALLSPEAAEEWLTTSLEKVNKSILQYAQDHEECKGMGTTIVAVVCSKDFISIAHVGDSRCYLANDQGFKQITEDHSLVNELVRSGQISKDDAEHHPRKNVLLKALGTEVGVQADVQSIGWEKGNRLLLCSDGLTNKFEEEELKEIVLETTELKEIAQSLIDMANERGGEDNISVVLIHHDEPSGEGES